MIQIPVTRTINRPGIRTTAAKLGLFCYLILLITVLVYFDNAMIIYGISFILVNFVIGVLFLSVNTFGSGQIFCYLIYTVYSIVYIFKSIIINATGLNTDYIFLTIKTVIGLDAYQNSLIAITTGHFVLVILFFVISKLPAKVDNDMRSKKYLGDISVKVLLVFVFVWIIFSSIVMFSYGVGVM